MRNFRLYVIIMILGVAWGAMVVRLWPGMDSFSNFVSVMCGTPVVVILAYFLNRFFADNPRI